VSALRAAYGPDEQGEEGEPSEESPANEPTKKPAID
jgi:hypothetical protein